MLQVSNSLVDTISGATLLDVIAKTSVTNCNATNTISPTFLTSTGDYNVSQDGTGPGANSLTDAMTGWFDVDYNLTATAQTVLTGAGQNGSNICTTFYIDGAPVVVGSINIASLLSSLLSNISSTASASNHSDVDSTLSSINSSLLATEVIENSVDVTISANLVNMAASGVSTNNSANDSYTSINLVKAGASSLGTTSINSSNASSVLESVLNSLSVDHALNHNSIMNANLDSMSVSSSAFKGAIYSSNVTSDFEDLTANLISLEVNGSTITSSVSESLVNISAGGTSYSASFTCSTPNLVAAIDVGTSEFSGALVSANVNLTSLEASLTGDQNIDHSGSVSTTGPQSTSDLNVVNAATYSISLSGTMIPDASGETQLTQNINSALVLSNVPDLDSELNSVNGTFYNADINCTLPKFDIRWHLLEDLIDWTISHIIQPKAVQREFVLKTYY